MRTKLQIKLKTDFTQRKKEIDKLIMEAVNAMQSSESSAESEPEAKPSRKRKESSEEDYKPTKSSKKRKGSSSEDSDFKETKKKKAKYTGKWSQLEILSEFC